MRNYSVGEISQLDQGTFLLSRKGKVFRYRGDDEWLIVGTKATMDHTNVALYNPLTVLYSGKYKEAVEKVLEMCDNVTRAGRLPDTPNGYVWDEESSCYVHPVLLIREVVEETLQ